MTFSLPFVDTKPEMNRYQVGKDIGLMVSTDPKKPRIMLEDGKVKIDKSMLIYGYSVLAVLILTPIGLLIYGMFMRAKAQDGAISPLGIPLFSRLFWHWYISGCSLFSMLFCQNLLNRIVYFSMESPLSRPKCRLNKRSFRSMKSLK